MVILDSVLTMRDSLIIMSVIDLLNKFGDKMILGLEMRKEIEITGFLLEVQEELIVGLGLLLGGMITDMVMAVLDSLYEVDKLFHPKKSKLRLWLINCVEGQELW
ncbi:hypothetical protein Tco_0764849 [Tanacetum coccineum]